MKQTTIFRYLLVIILAAPAFGDEPTPDFDATHRKWMKLDAEIDAIIESYRKAETDEERNALRQRYEKSATESRKLLPQLRLSAVAQLKAEGSSDERVSKTLIGLLASDVRQDEYEAALDLGALLAKHGVDDPVVDSFVGIAAYCADDFAKAETHLTKAKEANALTRTAEVCLSDVAKAKAAWAKELQIRATEKTANDLPQVRMETNKGTLLIELYENEAPQAVGNFISLVESGFYNGLSFHRVLPGFMAQGGCPDGLGTGGPGYKIYCECKEDNYRRHFRGSLSMAHAGPDTGGSQFFLTFKRTAHLDGRHTVFGRVVEGLDVLAQLQRRNPQQSGQPDPDTMVKVEVVRKREHEYKPVKVGE